MILFIVFLSCEKHEENSSSNPIVGYWELVKISGGFSGKIWTPDECAYLNIKSDGSFGFYNATGRLAVGTITTETDSNNDVWYWFNIDSTKSSFDAPLPMSKSCSDGFVPNCTKKADGSIDFTYQSKTYTAVPEVVNTYTEYFVNDASFPGIKTDGKARVFVRPNITRAKGIRTNMGGDYMIYYCSKFSYQDGLPMMTSPVFLRWGEVVLNRAEAYAKTGQDALALKDVNTIRNRAGLTGDAEMKADNINARGYATVLDCVLDERRRELCYEGHRMFDVFRNNLKMDRRYVGCHDWEIMEPNDPRIALLIPLDEINSSGIEQNPR